MHFTIATRDKLLQATYVITLGHVEFSDGRPPLKVGRIESVLDALRRAFRDCWIMDDHGRSHPPAAGTAHQG